MSAVRFIAVCLAVTAIGGIGCVWIAGADAQTGARGPEVERGAVIAAQGKAGAPACAQCHAFNGGSDGSGAFPRIAGQSAWYLAKQLRDFTTDVRVNAVMTPIAKALTSDDVTDLSAYYAGVESPFLPLPAADPVLIKRGEQLAKMGDKAKNLQSCDNCHGPGGVGEPPAIPYLAGQYAHYTAFQLRMWQRGFRKSSLEGMAVIARLLNDQDIAAVTAYYQQVRSSPEAAIAEGKD
jgi:cytochrome c553